jgi:uncharacterized protein with NRDE domain
LIGREKIDIKKIWEILADRSLPADEELPNTGVGLQWERILAPLFISSPDYGTRSSSIVLMEHSGQVTFKERTFLNPAKAAGDGETLTYSFKVHP